jgi:glutamine cyclotransferase
VRNLSLYHPWCKVTETRTHNYRGATWQAEVSLDNETLFVGNYSGTLFVVDPDTMQVKIDGSPDKKKYSKVLTPS